MRRRPEDPAGAPDPELAKVAKRRTFSGRGAARDDHHVPVGFAAAAVARQPSWTLALFDAGGHHIHVRRLGKWVTTVAPWLTAAMSMAE